ncbi:MAG: glycosyltransferase family 4 protein [Planctomycetes bacterium]|nr:glycosyltransferase family 4 protein [Planctomycetota bacterium]
MLAAPMRVLVTSPIFPPDLGGPAVYVPSLGRFLAGRGHEVTVVAFCADPRPQGYPFRVVAIERGPLLVRYLKAAWATYLQARKADVVYVNEHLALLHVAAARLAGRKVMIRLMVDGVWEISHRKGWIEGDDIETFEGKQYGWKVSLARRAQRRWWSWCHQLIACSDFLRRIPIEHYGVPERKVELVYNAYHGPKAADAADARASARARQGLSPQKRYLLTICRLMVWKRVDGILRALRGLPEDVELIVAGDGDMLEPWKALARELGLEQRAHFLGNVPYERIPDLICAADVFVLNSEYEGLSHTLLEVSALGTPIVCSKIGGNPEVVEHEHNGLLVPLRDDAALRAAIARLLDDEALARRFVAAGLERMQRFDRERTFGRIEQLLEGLARR